MSPVGPLDSFQRLEEFPTFISCIKCFGRPIIPPLLTPSRKCELQQIRIAAVNTEVKISKRRKDLQEQKNSRIFPIKDVYPHFPSEVQESCALWYPSSKDYQDGISIAISKLPSSGIYSSVHTGAIVCSDVIENNHRYASRLSRDSSYNLGVGAAGCIECSHSNINIDCQLCQAEYDRSSFHNCSFGSEVNPEVPCRSFSLQQNAGFADDEQYSTMEETEGESLPTVICIQKYVAPDTDSESNITCMTQSTDLDKYMELSCEFGSPDNSAETWDSKSTSQQFTLSRSDDASSETIVNTENELTPCASTLAEFTDNIEDELSNADEAANVSENKQLTTGTLRRAHSIDSYMKIIQSCARSMHFKKSSSEPFNTNSKLSSNLSDEIKASHTSKTSHLIKEDSKESEESKELPEKDICYTVSHENVSSFNDQDSMSNKEENLFSKKHVRRNSYTLDQPSSALILAHAECSCNLDANCISPPHCSALKDQEDQTTNFAFIKDKVEIDIPLSVQEKYPVLNLDSLVDDATVEGLTLPVVNVFPIIKEDSCEKSNLENSNNVEEVSKCESISTLPPSSNLHIKKSLEKSSIYSRVCDGDPNQDYFKKIYQELQESHETRVKKLLEEQNKQWMKLQEEFKEKEKDLYEKLKQTIASPSSESNHNPDFNEDDLNPNEVLSNSISNDDENKVSATDPVVTDSRQNCSFDTSSTENDKPENLNENCSFLACRSSEKVITGHVFNVSSEYETATNIPPSSINIIKHNFESQDSRTSVTCSYESDANLCSHISDSLKSMNGFSLQKAILLPPCDSQSFSNSLNVQNVSRTSFYEESPKECSYCAEVNGFKEYAVKPSPACIYSENALPNHIEPYHPNSSFASISSQDFNSCVVSSAHNSNNLQKINVPPKKTNSAFRNSKSISSQDNLHFTNHFTNTVHSKLNKNSNHTEPYPNSSFASISSQDFNSCGVSSAHNLDNLQKINDVPSKKTNSAFRNSKSISSQDDLYFTNTVHGKLNKSPSQPSLRERKKLSVDNIISLCVKSLKKGSVPPVDATTSKQTIINPAILKKFEKLPAFVKGYLTRRLFKTERVQNLIKTLQDTALLIGKLSEDLSMKGDAVSERDVDFHRQLIVQLMTTFHNVYDIFCTISTKERMNIISESRNIKLKQKMQEKQEPVASVISKAPVPEPSKKQKLSSATLKALERKKRSRSTIDSRTYTLEDLKMFKDGARSAFENRTYTIDDLKGRPGRPRSCTLSKRHPVSPSSVYKVSIGLAPKRKTASCKTSKSHPCTHLKWVP